MTLPKSDEWSITYSMRRLSQGYHWFENENAGTWHLAPNFGPTTEEELTGTKLAYDAMLQIRSVGVRLRDLKPDGNYLAAHDQEFRELVLPMAQKYGLLFETYDSGVFDDSVSWLEVLLDISDLWDLKRAMIEGKLSLVADRFQIVEDRAIFRRSSGKQWAFPASDPQARVWSRRTRWAKTPDRVTRDHLWAIFAQAINGYLESALSIVLDPLSMGDPQIQVRGLAPVVCARMWLEVVHQRDAELSRPQTCRQCGDPIEGTRRKEFCSNRCRMRFSRAKAA